MVAEISEDSVAKDISLAIMVLNTGPLALITCTYTEGKLILWVAGCVT